MLPLDPKSTNNRKPDQPAKNNQKRKSVHKQKSEQNKFDDSNFSNLPCIQNMLKGAKEGNRKDYQKRLASNLFQNDIPLDVANKTLLSFNSERTDPPRPIADVKGDVKSIYRARIAYGCGDKILSSNCSSECPTRAKTNITIRKKTLVFGIDDKGRQFMTIYDGRQLKFQLANGNEDYLADHVIDDEGSPVVPDPRIKDDIKNGHTFFPSEAVDYESPELLRQEIDNWLRKYIDMSEEDYLLCSIYVMLTWLYDQFNTCPYLNIIGESGNGKTRLKDLLQRVVFVPMPHSGRSTEAALFRITDQIRGTIVSDENDYLVRSNHNDMADTYKQGFQKGNPVLKVVSYGDGPDFVKMYNVYGPKIMTTLDRIYDKPLDSRCIKIILHPKFDHDRPIELPDEADREAQALRNKLLKYRFDELRKGKPNLQEVKGPYDPRSKQVMSPLFTIATSDKIKQAISAYLKKHHSVVITSRKQSLEGMVISAVRELFNEGQVAYCATIRGKVVAKSPELEKQLSPRKVGAILGKLGLKKEKGRKGISVPDTPRNKTKLSELENQYGLNDANNKGDNEDVQK